MVNGDNKSKQIYSSYLDWAFPKTKSENLLEVQKPKLNTNTEF